MEKLTELVINLSGTVVQGRYTISSKSFEIIKQTPKTFTINRSGSYRVMMNEVDKVTSDFKNNSINRLQYKIWAKEEDRDAAIKSLETAVAERVSYLSMIFEATKKSFLDGPSIEEN